MCIFENDTTLVMIGDSVTDAGRARPVAYNRKEELGKGYPSLVDALLIACCPQLRMRIINVGTSGNTSKQLLERWESDVMDFHPDYVSCMIGINDIWRQMDNPQLPERHVEYEEFMRNYEQMISRTVNEVKAMFVISCCFVEPNKNDEMRALADKYNAGAKALCEKYGAIYVDAQAAFDEGLKYHHSSYYTWDRVHPQLSGHLMIAREFVKAAGVNLG